jgi:pimeloyl-ACP methyl ester carboxylesterase
MESKTQKRSGSKTIVFIHGLFMNPVSWNKWVKFYEDRNYICHTPSYPYHEGNPDKLRQDINQSLGQVTLGQVVGSLSVFIDSLPEKPVLIGHSMGGLVVQKLIEMDKGIAGICIDPAPPQGIISLKWSFLKANLPTINPFRGNSVCLPDVTWFHYAFCNTMSYEETEMEYKKYLVPESRNIARTSTGIDGKIDFRKQHKPLMIIAGEKDNIVPASLIRRNFKAYRDKNSRIDFREFADRTHYICGQKGWEEVATFINSWIEALPA